MGTKRHICLLCGHKYDLKKGEPLQNIAPGIPFADLPDDWTCPVCFAEKKHFKPE